ncbi:Uncharacterised protein [Streptococcus equinus]|nr:Uncharacterised protein [Streptococcus equinus]VTS86194.1 Uncharacterised protein [Streptococcus equinus]
MYPFTPTKKQKKDKIEGVFRQQYDSFPKK